MEELVPDCDPELEGVFGVRLVKPYQFEETISTSDIKEEEEEDEDKVQEGTHILVPGLQYGFESGVYPDSNPYYVREQV